MADKQYQADVVIVGGGIAGIVTALELLDHNKKVLLLDRDTQEAFGGLAKWSFGGIFMVGTPQQRFSGAKDSPELAFSDWQSFAEFEPGDEWPRKWAEKYVYESRPEVYDWLSQHSVRFFPIVHWVERGLHQPGNSVPRFHMVWGTGDGLIKALVGHLRSHKNAANLTLHFQHHVQEIMHHDGSATGVSGLDESSSQTFEAQAEAVVIAAGGIGGEIERVRQHWHQEWGQPPEVILNGAHPYSNGDMHDAAARLNANITHMSKHWHYAAGIHHPFPRHENHGLSLVPPKSALWLNYRGERIGPIPLIAGYDTRYLVQQVCEQEEQYSWQVMNWKIAAKELAISGAEFNEAVRDKKIIPFLRNLLVGNPKLVQTMIDDCEDFVVADSVEELADKMNAVTGKNHVDANCLKETIDSYDAMLRRGKKFHNDEQIRRITHLRQYRGDRVRTCKFQPINDEKAKPFIAIREFILSRKTLGGIQTDLQSRVLASPNGGSQSTIDGLYAVGEAAGFGGGGSHGLRALEGTFLGTCILTGRIAAQSIAGS
jgi:hypothetical protein